MPGHRGALELLATRLAGYGRPGECWTWTGATERGYGRLSYYGRQYWAHRFAYAVLVGPVDEALVLDHLCGQPACCNPAHLEPVTIAENSRRGAPTIRTAHVARSDMQGRLFE